MAEEEIMTIGSGDTQEAVDARRTAWAARDTDPGNTPMTFEDIVRLLEVLATPEQIASVKRARRT